MTINGSVVMLAIQYAQLHLNIDQPLLMLGLNYYSLLFDQGNGGNIILYETDLGFQSTCCYIDCQDMVTKQLFCTSPYQATHMVVLH